MKVLADAPIEELNKLAAYENRQPIITPEMMPRKVKTTPIDEEWAKNIRDAKRFWGPDFRGNLMPYKDLIAMRNKIISFAGDIVCLPNIEEDLEKIMTRGQFWYGDNPIIMEGAHSHCHANSSYLWEANKDRVLLATGYALSDSGGMWRQHSWGVQPRKNDSVIIETTVERVAYFGFVMTKEESENFLNENE